MLKLSKGMAPLLVAGVTAAVVMAIVGSTGNKPVEAGSNPEAQPAKAGVKDDARSALPTKEELPEFEEYNDSDDSGGTITASIASAFRKADGTRLQVISIITGSEAEAKEWVYMRAVVAQSIGPFAKGSFSAQQIGQECWNSNRGGGPPRGAFHIIARDGRAIVSVSIDPPVKHDKKADPLLHELLDAKDVRKVEAEAIKVLDKLTKLGYTSKSAK